MDDKKLKITNEIINDAFWLSYILEIKRRVTDYNQKEVLSFFLLAFSSVFCDETISAGYGGMGENTITTEKEIDVFRNKNLKSCFKTTSNTAKNIIDEMGIDLENYVFDIVLSMSNSKIIDVNFRSWDFNKEEKTNLLECVISTPNVWMERLMPDLYKTMLELMKEQMEVHISRVYDYSIDKKSYSSYRLFSKTTLDSDNKIYILQRYGLVQLIKFVDTLFDKNISFSYNNLKFESERFIMKCKASLLEMFYNDLKNNRSITVLYEVFTLNESVIPAHFYALNRKIRDNLHYGDYHYLTGEEWQLTKKYQDVYIENVINVFDSKLHLNFGIGYELGLALAKIQKWCAE